MEQSIVELWADIGSERYWADLLDRFPGEFVSFEERWPQPGFIGDDFFGVTPRVVLMGQNPRASNTVRATEADQELFTLIRRHSDVRSVESLQTLFRMMQKFMTATSPYNYKPAWRPVSAAHKHLGLSLNSIAYLNLIPIATRNDRILPGFAPAFARSTRLQLQALQPDKVVVYGKGAFEALVRFAGNSWDVRYIEQRNFRMAPEVKRWLSA